ncbi:hypothetical protein J6590_106367 [Homalodisca vitripennis]|nr:hypothetical protein J6590_106367 [Homalodisca vitripennis]
MLLPIPPLNLTKKYSIQFKKGVSKVAQQHQRYSLFMNEDSIDGGPGGDWGTPPAPAPAATGSLDTDEMLIPQNEVALFKNPLAAASIVRPAIAAATATAHQISETHRYILIRTHCTTLVHGSSICREDSVSVVELLARYTLQYTVACHKQGDLKGGLLEAKMGTLKQKGGQTYRDTPVTEIEEMFGLQPLHDRRKCTDFVFLHRLGSGLLDCLSLLSDINIQVPRGTRSRSVFLRGYQPINYAAHHGVNRLLRLGSQATHIDFFANIVHAVRRKLCSKP